MRKLKKALKVSALVILIFAALAALLLVGLFVYARINIDFDGDTRLFEYSSHFESTCFYADSDSEDGKYTPTELEISGSLKKIHYSLEEIHNDSFQSSLIFKILLYSFFSRQKKDEMILIKGNRN